MSPFHILGLPTSSRVAVEKIPKLRPPGLAWSNDPQVTVGHMVRSLGLSQQEEELKRIRRLYQSAGVPSH
jgi:hypothetical protein